jgi:transposase
MPECARSQHLFLKRFPGTGCTSSKNNTNPKMPKATTKTKQNSSPPPQAFARIIGLDLHPDIFTAGTLVGSNPLGAQLTSMQDAVPIGDLEKWVGKQLRPGDLLVCEAGSNSFEVIERLRTLGYACLCLESTRVGQIKDANFNDDRSAAEKIARIYLSGLCKAVWQPDAQTREYRELLGIYQEAVRGATRAKNSLQSYLNEHSVRLPKGTALTKAEGEKLALASYQWSSNQQIMVSDHFAQVRHHAARRKAYYTRIATIIASDERMLGLMRLLGVNVVNAFALVATIGDITRFASPKKLVAYLGLVARREKSGTSIDRKGSCRGAGRKDMRALLVQAAQAVLNSRAKGSAEVLRKWGWKVFARRGKRAIAVIAIARKIAVSAWYHLRGKAHPHKVEETKKLHTKLIIFTTNVPKDRIQELGFTTKKAFVEDLITRFTQPMTPKIT